jgi:5-methylcytosine-specific restriction protein A
VADGLLMIGNRLRLATLPDASAYHCRVALRELSRHEILQAVAECDRLGQDRFLEKYGFGKARSYRLVVDDKTYDSKAIVGAAHGFLPGREPLAAADFSGGAATVGHLLSSLGFQVIQAVSGLSVGKLVELVSALRLYRSPTSRQALYQPLALLWAVGRAHQGLARMAEWSETETALGEFLERHGEHPWPHYPVTALYHAGLWDLGGPRLVPPAHGNASLHWFATNQPASGLPALVYDLVRYSGEARVAAAAAIVDKYLEDADYDAILADAGLAAAGIADDEVPAGDVIVVRSPLEEEYRRLCGIGAGASDRRARLGRPRVSVDVLRLESARRAVLLRSEGHCESPRCTGEPQDVTDAGHPILEVDHIQDLAKGGPDHPEQMIALCPNCHAIKTRGCTRERLRHELFMVARQRHQAILSR